MQYLLSRLFLAVLLLGMFVCFQPCLAQSADSTHGKVQRDSTATKRDTAYKSHIRMPVDEDSLAFAMRPHPFQPNPKKSGLYSAILPGLGQAYNRQYWKIPVVYAGIGIAAYFINNNLTQYQRYRKAYISRINNAAYQDEFTHTIDPNAVMAYLKQNSDDYSKYLDLSVLFTGIGYFMQVVDAITGAHLKNFDISRDISMHVLPVANPLGFGMGLVMTLK